MDKLKLAIKMALAEVKDEMKVAQIAEISGLKENRIYNLSTGRVKVQDDDIRRLRKALGKGPDWPESLFETKSMPMTPIPIVGSVAAGFGEYNCDIQERVIEVPSRLAVDGAQAFMIAGDSMMPTLEDGTLAIFRPATTPRRGMTFLLEGPDKALRAKILEWDRDQWMQVSINPNYKPEPLGNFAIIGMLIGWYRVMGSRESFDSDPKGLILGRQNIF